MPTFKVRRSAPAGIKMLMLMLPGTIIALYLVGGIFGSLSCIQLGDILGRRWIIFIASGVSIIGAVLMATSYSLAQFIVARLVLGFGTGGYVATVPVWHAELSKPAKRGADVVTVGFFIGMGITASLWIDFGFYFIDGSSISWRIPLALQVVLSITVMIFVFLLPESPRWLIKKGRLTEAREILAIMEDTEATSQTVSNILTGTQTSLKLGGTASVLDVFKQGEQRLFNRTLLAVLGQLSQQVCGINAISFYATVIFQVHMGLDATKSRILAAAMATTQPIGGIVAYYTIDRFGRRKLMLSCAVVMCILMAVLAATTSFADKDGALIVAIIALFLFPFVFTIGFAGLTFLYATEIAPLQHRAAINALSTAAVWIANFLLAQVTPTGFETLGYRYYIIFACINAVIVPMVYFLFPETRGLSLEQIDHIFAESRGMFEPVRVAKQLTKPSGSDTESGDLTDI